MKYDFLKIEKKDMREQATFIGDGELLFYVPKAYFDDGYAKTIENRIRTMGIVAFKYKDKFYKLLLPIKIEFEFTESTKFKGKLKPEIAQMEYNVFVLKTGDAFVYDINHPQDINDLDFFFNNVIAYGKIPAFIKYNDSISVVLQLLLSGGLKTKLGVSSVLLEGMMSQMYRNINNIYEPYRLVAGKPNHHNQYDYKLVGLKKVPALTSIFSSVTGEDTTSQIANSIIRTRTGVKDFETPLEKLIKY